MLDEAIESFLDLYLNTRAESLFYPMLNEDSYLDHRDQIALALSLVRAKAPKTANWFYEPLQVRPQGQEQGLDRQAGGLHPAR